VRRGTQLDQPRSLRRTVSYDAEAFGRWSERLARFFGTARYLGIQTVVVIAWIAVNVVWGLQYNHAMHGCVTTQRIVGNQIVSEGSPDCSKGSSPFDPYPFILLNLLFSTQAAYAAPLILLAQNRQAARDRVQAENDRASFAQNAEDVAFLAREIAHVRIVQGQDSNAQTMLLKEVRALESRLAELLPNPRQPAVNGA
jgi:uncharacterized membrane protein